MSMVSVKSGKDSVKMQGNAQLQVIKEAREN